MSSLDLGDIDAVNRRRRDLGSQTFVYRGNEMPYHVDGGNHPYDNERAVELPLAARRLSSHADPGTVIEVGNVMSHYFDTHHAVLDKYELHRAVTWNEDILDFRPPFAPELIISVSTLEHVGHVERPRDPTGFARAVASLRSWLAPGGELFFTVPLGYNPSVLQFLEDPPTGLNDVTVMSRRSSGNDWVETSLSEAREAHYGHPFPCANAMAIVTASAVRERLTDNWCAENLDARHS